MLSTRNLSFQFTGQAALSFPDIDIVEGSHSLIIGPSGCGKTTLLHLLAGLRSPSTGKVTIDKTDLTTLSSGALDQFRGKHIGIVFQTPHFVNALNVYDNIILAPQLSGKKLDRQRVLTILDRLGIREKENKLTEELSIGEQQRVAIARALINQPKIIFADEPTSALDDNNTKAVVDLLIEQATASNATLIVVTHDNRLKDLFSNRIELGV
ncbi:MAG: ABC-type lipoprotein export system ATPase subunit [Saprospiraceae bacterium]|jgi:ABC-type lipoprotein export system ATPase subunit